MMSGFWKLEQHGDALAFVQDDGQSITYSQAAQDADRLASCLGAGRKLVFILCDNDIESNIAYLACLRSNHVPLLLNAGIGDEPLKTLCSRYRPHFIWRKGGVGDFSYGRYGLEAAQNGHEIPMHEDLGLLLTTSGSTGSPKLVRLSKANIRANSASIVEYLGLGGGERAITVLPMYYSYGLSVINSHLHVGARILLTGASIIQKPFWAFFQNQEATSLVGVPYTYAMYERIGLFRMELPSLRYMTQAGGRLAGEKVKVFADWAQSRGLRFFVMYGQTEATARMSYLPPEKAAEKSRSVGLAIPGGKFSIVDADGTRITESGKSGELLYHGPNVSLGYAECAADLQKGDENQGLLRTGDLAHFDDEGHVYISGRLKRFIKIAGNRVGLDELEELFRQHGAETFCCGRDDLLCVAVRQESDGVRARQLIDERLRFHHTMYRIGVVSEIPRNSAGKIQYDLLRKEVCDD